MKKILYQTIDNAILAASHKVGDYRKLGAQVIEDRKKRTPTTNNLHDDLLVYFLQKQGDAAFQAYWDVLAQYCLIHVDVFGLDTGSNQAKNAVAEIGRVFQWLKIADDIADEREGSKRDNPQGIQDIITGTQLPKNPNERLFLEEYRNLQLQDNTYIDQFFRLEVAQCTARNDSERYRQRGKIGSVLGKLEYEILKKYLPDFPSRAEKFFALGGVAGAYFDDFKDFDLDRGKGQGYEREITRLKLLYGWVSNTFKAMQSLQPKEQRNHLNFLMLAALYQLRELIGIKERT